jgi:DNA-binding beta-propeller fold protein YncE
VRTRIELAAYYISLAAVLAVASYFGPPERPALSRPTPTIETIARRDSYATAISAADDGSVYLIFYTENEVFRHDGKSAELKAVASLLAPGFVGTDKLGNVYASYGVTGDGCILDHVAGLLTQRKTIEKIRIHSSVAGLAVDSDGSIYLTAGNVGEVWKVDAAGQRTLLSNLEQFHDKTHIPTIEGIAVNKKGQILVVDNDGAVFLLEHGQLRHLAGKPRECGTADGIGENARFCGPTAATADHNGDFLVVDQDCAVRKVTPSGEVTTLIGTPDGPLPGLVRLPEEQCSTWIRSIAVDRNGDILLAARSALRVRFH